jgi:colanic acid biosynthesis glycosyl transferase WcaI
MRVLVIGLLYAPDLGASAALYTMLCEDLVRLGHQVSVIAAVPHYPSGRVFAEFRGSLISREQCNGVDVTRVWVPSVNRAHLGQRLLTFLAYQGLATISGLRRRYDVMIVANPALEVFLPFTVLATLRRRPAIFSVHDLYPDVGIKLGIFRHRLVTKIIAAMENECLRSATYVRVLSEGFRQSIQTRGIPDSKIALVWDWLDTDFIQPQPRVNPFSKKFGLDHCFTVQYAGNIGLSQGLEQVVEAATLLGQESALRIVFVGDGAGKTRLFELVTTTAPTNIQFIPFQPREELPLVLASADVSLISLKSGISNDSVPSKFYSILASARPLIALVDRGSDTWQLVERAACGVCVEPGDPKQLATAILKLYHDNNSREEMGSNGRAYVVRYHSRTAAAQEFHKLICSVGADNARTGSQENSGFCS